MRAYEDLKIAVAGTGYVGMSIATLLAQHHEVIAVDVVPEKVEKINQRISPIQDEYIERYLAEKPLRLTATLDAEAAYKEADIVVTNPPFSLFREYLSQLVKYDKKFLIIGNMNAITYKEVFPLIMSNRIWLGYGFNAGNAFLVFHQICPETGNLGCTILILAL